jgi:hypothetical protein
MCARSVSEVGCKSRGREEGYRLGGQLRVWTVVTSKMLQGCTRAVHSAPLHVPGIAHLGRDRRNLACASHDLHLS